MNIKITASNAIELDQFIPVDGAWSIEDKQDSDSITDVKESIENWMDAIYPIEISVYRADGRQITCELPWEGTFIAIRK